MSQLVKGLSHILSNCYRNNSPEKAVSASQILEYYETKCASVHIFSIKKLVLWNSFKKSSADLPVMGTEHSSVRGPPDNTNDGKCLYSTCGLGNALSAWDQSYSAEAARTGVLEQSGTF